MRKEIILEDFELGNKQYLISPESLNYKKTDITYNIEVEDIHMYYANGIYVKNCGRIPAMLFSLNIRHPDVEKFISVKKDYTQIQNANISVQITDSFYEAVENDQDWTLFFEIPGVARGDKVWIDVHSIDVDCKQDGRNGRWYKIATHDKKAERFEKIIKARSLMELIAKNMCDNAEPGIQNIDVARKYSNSDYLYDPKDPCDSRILSTNACCVVEDSKILTDSGWKTIKEIYELVQKNEKFLAMSYNIVENKFELKPIINAWQQRNDHTITLIMEENGKKYEIECSIDHPILTKNRGYVRADSLTDEDDIVIHK